MESSTFVLIHSPLVGPLTWTLVTREMKQGGLDVIVPVLNDSPESKDPYWKQHAESVSRALAEISSRSSIILVAHSGAGPLLPAIRRLIANPIQAYVFMDAGIPRNSSSRLDLMASEDPEWTERFQEQLERGEHYPNWSSHDLREIIPDEHLRNQLVAEIRPRGLDFFSEPIPVFSEWPDAPCIYIRFSESYLQPAMYARQAGWLTYELVAGHFHMLVDAVAVANMIVESVNNLD